MSPSPRLAARDRLVRLLAVIPWVAERDGARLDEISNRFDYPRDQLLADLQDVVFFVGVHPFTPDTLIDVDLRDGRVWIRYADWFSKPLRLTAEEGARLLTAGRSVLNLTGDNQAGEADDLNESGPLLRALAKLHIALGEGADQAVEVRFGDAPEKTLDALRRATETGRQLELEYYSYGRDELTRRRVDPTRVFSDQGNWYLAGWCHRAGDDRVFRVDRIRSAEILESPVDEHEPVAGTSFTPSGDDPRVALRIPASQRWVVEQYPTESVVESMDGRLDVRMAVTATPWLERLLLRLGPDAEILTIDDPLTDDIGPTAARRVLARYRPDGASPDDADDQ